jgi:hypothetical protein
MQYPRKFICVKSASYPSDWKHNTDEVDFNAIANHIANEVNRTPFERMADLIKEKTLERSIKELKSNQ